VVEVEVVLDLEESISGIAGVAEAMAIQASSHNRADPSQSSVLSLGWLGQAEVVKQDIKSRVEVKVP